MTDKSEIKTERFDKIASDIFTKIYPLIARQAIEKTGIKDGICIDIGSGGGHLGLAISEVVDMEVYLYDISYDAKEITERKIKDKGIQKRVKAIMGDVHSIPIKDNTIDLVVSRASYHFWEDKVKAIKEIYRILKSGAKTYIGGGYGSARLEEEIENEMIARKVKGWVKGKKKKDPEERKTEIIEVMKEAKIEKFKIIIDESGYWIIISKP